VCALLVCFFSGCHSCDLLESELRTRENQLYDVKSELARSEAQNAALVRELTAVRQNGPASITPEQASQTYTLKDIVLGRGTGGYDDDDLPGDEALQVVVEPRDGDSQAIKAPGTLHVEALEISPEGLKAPISAWDIPPERLRRSWRSGLLSSGYILVLPWQQWPASEKIRVVARFTLMDGRMFEADKDVTVHLIPDAQRKSPSSPENRPAAPTEQLPLPRKGKQGAKQTAQKWWLPPPETPAPQPQLEWQPKAKPELVDAIQLLRPVAVTRQFEDE
jgi:hypothetical protein